MKLNNRMYSRNEIEKKVGNIYQLGGARCYELSEGSAKGTRAVDMNTGSGFNFTVLPDRGLDISLASYKGINLVYQTQNGEVNPSFYHPCGLEWLGTFFAGLLTTCGLTYFGHPGVDEGEELGLHGRHSATPAKKVCDSSRWDGDDYLLEISGVIDSSVPFGHKVRMTRTISSRIGEKSVRIHDEVQNYGSAPAPFTILYHVNAGFPLLDEGSEFLTSSDNIEPYDAHAAEHIHDCKKIIAPVANFKEQCYLHKMLGDNEGNAFAAILNRNLANGIGLYVKFGIDSLPYLTEWKMMGETDYVVGMEPCNTKCLNRGELRRQKMLPFLQPCETKHLDVEIGVLEGEEEIEWVCDIKVGKLNQSK